jgi:hypothetical protein
MKVTIDVNCTPSEARRFLGLPDFEPLQAAVMKELERGTLEELRRFSPDSLLKNWLSAGSIRVGFETHVDLAVRRTRSMMEAA